MSAGSSWGTWGDYSDCYNRGIFGYQQKKRERTCTGTCTEGGSTSMTSLTDCSATGKLFNIDLMKPL